MSKESHMMIRLPELEERVYLNGDGEGQTFGRNAQGRIVVFSGDGDHSNGGWWDCFSQFWDACGSIWGCVGFPLA
jgi:hypothetical protein